MLVWSHQAVSQSGSQQKICNELMKAFQGILLYPTNTAKTYEAIVRLGMGWYFVLHDPLSTIGYDIFICRYIVCSTFVFKWHPNYTWRLYYILISFLILPLLGPHSDMIVFKEKIQEPYVPVILFVPCSFECLRLITFHLFLFRITMVLYCSLHSLG